MTECNAIIEANNEIDRLKRENRRLNELCVQYGFDIRRVEDENDELKETIKTICKDYENYHGMDIRNAEWFTAW